MNIANIRRARGLTQADLADMAGITQPTVSRAEKGDDGCTLGILKAIAEALSVPLSDLFAESRTPAETIVLSAFRKLPADRQRGWLDLAETLTAGQPLQNEETQ